MGRFRAVSFFSGLLFALLASISVASPGEPCTPEWVPTFGGAPGVDGSFEARIRAMVEFDDGSGAALYVGGTFVTAGGVEATGIARWDGESWSAVGGGITLGVADFNSGVYALKVFDDGSGPALYAAGKFAEAGGVNVDGVARWDGKSWTALGEEVDAGGAPTPNTPFIVRALEVFDDGSGPALYAGGVFTEAGETSPTRLARWDGQRWVAIAGPLGGVSTSVKALRTFDDGAGDALYVGGDFRSCPGGMCMSGLLRWDGAAWSTPGEFGSFADVRTIAVHDDGAGPALYVGGGFVEVSGVSARNVAKWDGASWSALGPGLSRDVEALIGGSLNGEQFLYALGQFPLAGTLVVNNVARWDGANWSAMQGGLVNAGFGNGGGALAFASLEGAQSSLFVGGVMSGAGDVDVLSIAEWDGDSWQKLGGGLNRAVLALETFSTASGESLVVGGQFNSVGAIALEQIGLWDGDKWSAFSSAPATPGFAEVRALHSFDNGGVETLLVGGRFEDVDASRVELILAWDGERWSPLGAGLAGATPEAFVQVHAIATTDSSSLGGPAIFATGDFVLADGEVVNGIARWDGNAWAPVGGGIDGLVAGRGGRALAVFDDGSGAALYLGGIFESVDGVPAAGIAKWNGQVWSSVGGGLEFFELEPAVLALEVFDDGSGPALFVGGSFNLAGGVETRSIAKWDGQAWWGLDGGLSSPNNSVGVNALAAADASSGLGRALFVGGFFSSAGGVEALNIARWSGSEWSSIGAGLAGGLPRVYALQAVGGESELGPALYVGGRFSASAGGDSFLARLVGCAIEACPGDATGDQVVDMKDLNAAVSAFGQTGEPGTIPGDVNGDGTVDFQDLIEILSNFGQTCG